MTTTHLPGRGGLALGLENLDLTLQFLMTRYARKPDPERAQAVARHLAMVLNHPLVAEQLEYRTFYRRQLACWQGLAGMEDKRHRRKGLQSGWPARREAPHG
jgi:hypothetical protein